MVSARADQYPRRGRLRSSRQLFDHGVVDEVHVYVAPLLVGGKAATTPAGGKGVEKMADALRLFELKLETLAGDVYLNGRVRR